VVAFIARGFPANMILSDYSFSEEVAETKQA
jgi:hypothetical protein